MKEQDIATLIVVVVVAGVAAFIISNKFITPSNEQRSAYTVSDINSEFPLPDSDMFNSNALNPSVKIKIAPGENNQPFIEQ